jgi:hypothetical protein
MKTVKQLKEEKKYDVGYQEVMKIDGWPKVNL